jgi:hypothetical protein
VAVKQRVLMLMTGMGQTYPYQHPDWAITPPPGKTLAEIATAPIIAAGEQALGN